MSVLSRKPAPKARMVHRSAITPAPYNPRAMDKHARKKLRESLDEFGVTETLVWNEANGVLVGGHMRLAVLDEKYPDLDYEVEVSAVNLDPVSERRLNVLLNQPNLSGSFDLEALGRMIESTPGLDPMTLGFDAVELGTMFTDMPNSHLFSTDGDPALAVAQQVIEAKANGSASADDVQRMKAKKLAYREQFAAQNDEGFYVVLVFGDRDECDRFLRAADLPMDRKEQDGRAVASLMGIDLDKVQ